MHVVFTPKLQRIRLPEFGTDLIKFIFEPSESITWEAVKNEVSDSVRRWTNNIILNDIQVIKNEEDENEIYVRLDYSVTNGNQVTNDSIVTRI
jgi:phage baseplate assembly protein W